ncbi:MAG: ERAP1-like C-terminal domain-containing protein [Candidatus Microbacterium colombiense]|nr:MAG: ERAP1-like C-terminal domain-containing protein [Microbacterium sp.]
MDVDGDRTEVPELQGIARPDLVLLNDDDLAYAKIRLDEQSLATAIAHLADIHDPLARSLVWGAAWDQTRDAESAASDYIDLVLGNIGRRPSRRPCAPRWRSCARPRTLYVDPAERDAARQQVADGLWDLAESAVAGSDSQLQFVTAFANAPVTPEHAGVIGACGPGKRRCPDWRSDRRPLSGSSWSARHDRRHRRRDDRRRARRRQHLEGRRVRRAGPRPLCRTPRRSRSRGHR